MMRRELKFVLRGFPMKTFRHLLLATLLIVAVSSAAFAGDMPTDIPAPPPPPIGMSSQSLPQLIDVSFWDRTTTELLSWMF
jgi:hypothetical protein